MTKRFYIGKKQLEECEDLEEWISSKIPDPPPGTICECDKDKHAHESEPDENGMVGIIDCTAPATAHLYYVKGVHICYSWMCDSCVEAQCSDTYLGECVDEVPTTADGYAVTPQHCT